MKLTLVGLGTVAVSVGLAIKAVTDQVRIVGHDPDPGLAKRAKSLRALDQTEWNLISACEDADMVFLDLPLGEFEKTMEALRQAGAPSGSPDRPALILDNVSVKRPVIEIAQRLAWEGAELIGGHLVSPHFWGDPEPSAQLLRDSVLYLVPTPTSSQMAIETATNFGQSIGAEPRFIDAAEHDGIVAPSSQIPFVSALALLNTLRQAPGAPERSRAIGPSLSALMSILATEGGAETDELLTNRDNLLHWMDLCERELALWRDLLGAQDSSRLRTELPLARKACLEWLGKPADGSDAEARPEDALGIRSLLLGDLGRKKRGRSPRNQDKSRTR